MRLFFVGVSLILLSFQVLADNDVYFELHVEPIRNSPLTYVQDGKKISVKNPSSELLNCFEYSSTLGIFTKYQGSAIKLAMASVVDLYKKPLAFIPKKNLPKGCPQGAAFIMEPKIVFTAKVEGENKDICIFDGMSVNECLGLVDKFDDGLKTGPDLERDMIRASSINDNYRAIVNEKGTNYLRITNKNFSSTKQ